jgi:hypothetical protein
MGEISQKVRKSEILFADTTVCDEALKVLLPTTNGVNGWVSLEVSPFVGSNNARGALDAKSSRIRPSDLITSGEFAAKQPVRRAAYSLFSQKAHSDSAGCVLWNLSECHRPRLL